MPPRIAAIVLLAFVSLAPQAGAQGTNYVMAGASPGGLWTLLGTAVDRAVRTAYPGSSVTYQTSGGGFANAVLVQQKKAPLGLVQNVELKLAVEGKEPFKAPITELRAIAQLYNFTATQMVLTKAFADKYGIATVEDIATKKPPIRMGINKRGNAAYNMVQKIFEAAGISLDDIPKWGGQVVYAASAEQVDLIKDRRLDMTTNVVFVGNNTVIEIAQTHDVVLVGMSKPVRDKVKAELGVEDYVIKAGAYPWLKQDLPTLSMSVALVTHAQTEDKVAYDLARALIEHLDKVREVHKAMQELTAPALAGERVIPYHPGAIKAYKEAKLMN
ncbi:MAG: TAXI family TRAP transporter solute-binding subunit [Alphaproteobacteria bacterium]|nr:TAXI family TRAP transporter solute-binding subunit [Alphaproteobacteria bacterium]